MTKIYVASNEVEKNGEKTKVILQLLSGRMSLDFSKYQRPYRIFSWGRSWETQSFLSLSSPQIPFGVPGLVLCFGGKALRNADISPTFVPCIVQLGKRTSPKHYCKYDEKQGKNHGV